MRCKRCNFENEIYAKFCGKCGIKLEQEIPTIPKEKSKGIGRIIAVLVLITISIAVGFGFMGKNTKKTYETWLEKGDCYMDTLEYEKAETTYLEAISIAPQKVESYIRLAELYIQMGKNEKATNILEEAEKNVEEIDRLSIIEKQEELQEKVEETKLEKIEQEFAWYLEPTIEADDIFMIRTSTSDVSKETVWGSTNNEAEMQYMDDSVVVKRGNTMGLMNYEGHYTTESDYMSMMRHFGDCYVAELNVGDSSHYMMHMIWNNEGYKTEETMVFGGVGAPTIEWDDGLLWTIFEENENQKVFPETMYGVEMVSDLESNSWGGSRGKYSGTYGETSKYVGQFAVFKDQTQITDFIFEKVTSEGCGLIGVMKNGKWGYINSQGETIIPFEYDDSWTFSFKEDQGYGGKDFSYAYVPTEDSIVLCKDGMYELRSVNNEVIISLGMYEEILPVYKGKCWVKQNGKWGIIQLEENEVTDVSELYRNIIEQYIAAFPENEKEQWSLYKTMPEASYMYNFYSKLSDIGYKYMDVDNNGVEELLIGIVEENDSTIFDMYTVVNGQVIHLLGSEERYTYRLCSDGSIVNTWSSSSVESGMDKYIISPEGNSLMSVECVIYSGFHAEDIGLIEDAFNRSPNAYFITDDSGDYNSYVSISKEEAEAIQKGYCDLYTEIAYTPFSEYK